MGFLGFLNQCGFFAIPGSHVYEDDPVMSGLKSYRNTQDQRPIAGPHEVS